MENKWENVSHACLVLVCEIQGQTYSEISFEMNLFLCLFQIVGETKTGLLVKGHVSAKYISYQYFQILFLLMEKQPSISLYLFSPLLTECARS